MTECCYLSGSHRRPGLDFHLGCGQSDHCWQRPGRQGWRPHGRPGGYSASICQYGPYATGSFLPFFIHHPLSLSLSLSTYLKGHGLKCIKFRYSTQSTPPPSTTPRPYTKPKRKAMRKKRTGKTRRRTGARNRKRRMRRTVLLIQAENIKYIVMMHISSIFN